MLKEENRPAQAAEASCIGNYTNIQPENQEISMYCGFSIGDAGKTARVGDVLQAIRAGRWAQQVLRLRELDAEGRADEYSSLKSRLPFATFAGTFLPCRKKENLRQPSGVMVADIDGLSHERAIKLKTALKADNHIFSVFLSPAHGIKTLVRVNIADDTECKAAFRDLEKYFFEKYGIQLDKSGSDVCRACFASFDSDLWINYSAVPFRYETIVAAATRPTAIIIPIKGNPRLEGYVLSAINSELENICNAPEGCGTSSLYRAAIRAGELSFTGLFCRSAVESHFIRAFLERKHSSNTLAHAEITFNNGWNLGENQPRQLPVEVMR
ncbi:MAG: hypothetical protein EOM80_14600 [Erysipelotrichia bacterium]|nr:hypothetical protein [Erysipelotrichia bacterium]